MDESENCQSLIMLTKLSTGRTNSRRTFSIMFFLLSILLTQLQVNNFNCFTFKYFCLSVCPHVRPSVCLPGLYSALDSLFLLNYHQSVVD